jgi:hypothetical protein
MTLSDHKGKQIISDTIQKLFLQDFQTMFIWTMFKCLNVYLDHFAFRFVELIMATTESLLQGSVAQQENTSLSLLKNKTAIPVANAPIMESKYI